jgi:hypothetical protein
LPKSLAAMKGCKMTRDTKMLHALPSTAVALLAVCLGGCAGQGESYAKLKLGQPIPPELLSKGIRTSLGWGEKKDLSNPYPVMDGWQDCLALCDSQDKVILKAYAEKSFYCDGLVASGCDNLKIEVMVPADWFNEAEDAVSLQRFLKSLKTELQKKAARANSAGEISFAQLLAEAERSYRAPQSASGIDATSVPAGARNATAFVMLAIAIASGQPCGWNGGASFIEPEELDDAHVLDGVVKDGFRRVVAKGLTRRLEIENLGGRLIRITLTDGATLPTPAAFIFWLVSGAKAG